MNTKSFCEKNHINAYETMYPIINNELVKYIIEESKKSVYAMVHEESEAPNLYQIMRGFEILENALKAPILDEEFKAL